MSFDSNYHKHSKMIIIVCYILAYFTTFNVFNAQRLYVHSPKKLSENYVQGIEIKLSPLGFDPRSGQLDGLVLNANPIDACSSIQYVQNLKEDVFIMADDTKCFQSTKAKNIMKSGGLVGMIRQNPNITLHDKQINIVHIPILQLSHKDFDYLSQYISQNPSQSVVMSVEFSSKIIFREIKTEIWMTPTQVSSYRFLLNMQNFFDNQQNQVEFFPRYATNSQIQQKSFIGCYSNGMYCPGELSYDGKQQGQNVMEQVLRQIVIRDLVGMDQWWSYIKSYYVQCLHNSQGDVMMSHKALSVCSKNSMMLAGIDLQKVDVQMNRSFTGARKTVDDNVLLRQQRQDYVREKITTYPVLLINKKEYHSIDQTSIQSTICRMQSERSKECSKLLNGDLEDIEVYIIGGVILLILVVILVGYRIFMYRRMQKQMKRQVASTLDQYYRYMDTLDGSDNLGTGSTRLAGISGHTIGANQAKGYRDDPQDENSKRKIVQIQMGDQEIKGRDRNTQKNKMTKEGHTTLVEQDE